MRYDITLVTADPLPEPDPDLLPLKEGLEEAGLSTRIAVWDDPEVDWSQSGLTLLRSTWDYYRKLESFRAWIETTSRLTNLQNPPEVIRWNLHKGYLLKLPLRGVPIIPTVLVEAGSQITGAQIVRNEGWENIVLKPAVSAGSFQTHAMHTEDFNEELFQNLLAERDLLIQPYIDSVHDYGERSLLFFDGRFSHCVRKSPRFAADEEQISGPFTPTEAERRIAELALHRSAPDLLYARVDLVTDAEGQPMVAELELIEPSLFFRFAPDSLTTFVEAIKRRR